MRVLHVGCVIGAPCVDPRLFDPGWPANVGPFGGSCLPWLAVGRAYMGFRMECPHGSYLWEPLMGFPHGISSWDSFMGFPHGVPFMGFPFMGCPLDFFPRIPPHWIP